MTSSRVAPGQRGELWLSLLRRLTAASATWLVWKNVESALTGQGDIDSAAAPADWDVLEGQLSHGRESSTSFRSHSADTFPAGAT